jgi:hypothetical protein
LAEQHLNVKNRVCYLTESNNETMSNFSIKGDKYIYQILSKENGFYLMTVNIPGQETFEEFKM